MIAHAWQSTLCALVVGGFVTAFRRHRAAVRYRLWIAASLKFLVPFSWLSAAGALLGHNEHLTETAAALIGAAIPAVAVQHSLEVAVALPALTASDSLASSRDIAWAIIAIWCCGVVFVAVRSLSSWYSVRQTIRAGTILESGREVSLLRQLERRHGTRRALALIAVDRIGNPGVFGLVRPVLLWPRHMSARLADEHIEAILDHELAHVRHRDNVFAAVHLGIQAIFWFSPAVWWIGRKLIDTREAACDETVLARGTARDVYAAGILRACEFGAESAWCLAGAGGRDLKQRMVRIMNGTALRPLAVWQIAALVSVAVIGLTGPVVYGLSAPRGVGGAFSVDAANTPARAWSVTAAGMPVMTGFSARDLVRYAYGVQAMPVVDGPTWIDNESYTVSAVGDAANEAEWMAAVRDEFEGRFGLLVHVETRHMSVAAMRFSANADSASTMRPALPCFDGDAWRAAGSPDSGLQGEHQRMCGRSEQSAAGTTFTGVTMAQLAAWLTPPAVTRPVVDQTGLDGRFDIDLRFFPPAAAMIARSPFAAAALEPMGFTSIPDAMRDQLGLTLTDAEVPMNVLVIDHFERP